jgi:hypothetical protein
MNIRQTKGEDARTSGWTENGNRLAEHYGLWRIAARHVRSGLRLGHTGNTITAK